MNFRSSALTAAHDVVSGCVPVMVPRGIAAVAALVVIFDVEAVAETIVPVSESFN